MTYLLVEPSWTVGSAMTRGLISEKQKVLCFVQDPRDPTSKGMAKLGATLVQGYLRDVNSISRALKGCNGIFIDSIFWHYSVAVVRNVITAAKNSDIKMVILLTLENLERTEPFHKNSPAYSTVRINSEIKQMVKKMSSKCWCVLELYWFTAKMGYRRRKIPNNYALMVAGLRLNSKADLCKLAMDSFKYPTKFHRQVVKVKTKVMTEDDFKDVWYRRYGRKVEAMPVTGAEMDKLMDFDVKARPLTTIEVAYLSDQEEQVTKAPLKPVTKEPFKSVTKETLKPVTKEPLKPVTKEPLKPITKAPLKPITKAPLKPVTEEPLKPVTTEPLKPSSKTPLKPASKTCLEPCSKAPLKPSSKAPFKQKA